jgi:AcrR family transcriptional regulator
MPPIPRRTAEERRKDVIAAATYEFCTYGYHGGSTERIAVAAEISQPYVQRLFGTKLNLFIATMEAVCESILARWTAAMAGRPERGWDALMVLGASYTKGDDTSFQFRMILQAVAAAEQPEIESAINAHMDRLWQWVAQITGATTEEIQRFWAFGMMQTMGLAMNADKYTASSPRARAMVTLPRS